MDGNTRIEELRTQPATLKAKPLPNADIVTNLTKDDGKTHERAKGKPTKHPRNIQETSKNRYSMSLKRILLLQGKSLKSSWDIPKAKSNIILRLLQLLKLSDTKDLQRLVNG